MSVAAPRMIGDYHLSDVQFGLLSTAFLIGYALLQTPAGWLADRWGPRRVLAGGVVWWGIFTAVTASVPLGLGAAFAVLLLARFALGAGEAVMYPGSSQFVARWIPTHERGLANGLIFAGVGVGSAASPPLVTYILIHHGWRYSFWMCAFIGLAVGLIWFVMSRDKPEQHPWVSLGRSRDDPFRINARRGETRRDSHSEVLGALGHYPFQFIRVGHHGFLFLLWVCRLDFLRLVLCLSRESPRHEPEIQCVLWDFPFLAMALGCAVGGLIADRLTKKISRRAGRCGVAIVGIAFTAIFLAFGSTVNSAPLASIILAGGAGALYLSQSSYWAITADIGGRFSGSISGFMNMGCQFGGAVTSFLTPYIAQQFGWTASFLVAAGLSVVGCLSWLLVNPDRPVASDEAA